MPKYVLRTPSGSRADVKAHGVWQDQMWTIVLARKLDTGHDDDVKFAVGGTYKFGVSIYSLYGKELPTDSNASFAGKGRISDMLLLKIEG